MTSSLTHQPIHPDDYFRLRFLQDAALSPDGRHVVYTVSHTETEKPAAKKPEEEKPEKAGDAGEVKEYRTIHLLRLGDGSTKPITTGQHQDHSPAWSPDGRWIAFLSDRTGKPQLFLLPLDGGEARQVTELVNGVDGALVWSPDGRHIAFTAADQDAHDPQQPYRVTRPLWRFDAINRTDRSHQDLWTVEVETGECRPLTDDGWHYILPRWSPDGTKLLAVAMLGPDTHDLSGEVRIISLEGKVRRLTGDWGNVIAVEWTPGGQGIVFAGVPDGTVLGVQNDLWGVPAAGGAPQCLTPGLDFHVGAGLQPDFPALSLRRPRILCHPQSRAAYVRVQQGGTVPIYRVPLDGAGEPTIVVDGDRSCELLDLCGDRLLFAASDLNHPPDLYLADLTTGAERRLTDLNRDLLARRTLPEVVQLTFAGEDGVDVEGWVLLPAAGSAPYPGFLYIHGGPHGAFGHAYHFDFQMLAGAGYAVLIVNHRASTGYGDDFATAIHGDWGHLDYTDLMAGLDYAIAQGYLDPERLALGGLSGGGNLTCWIVGQTDRFQAAIPENPVTNWVSFYGVSDIGPWFAVRELGGHPHEIPEVYRRCSPITYAHRCTTPTLLVQGEADWRCPAEQSEQFYTVLKVNGCPVEMLRLPGSAHGGAIVGKPALRQAQNEALLDWVQRYVPALAEGPVAVE